jgi:hypothetical protein
MSDAEPSTMGSTSDAGQMVDEAMFFLKGYLRAVYHRCCEVGGESWIRLEAV